MESPLFHHCRFGYGKSKEALRRFGTELSFYYRYVDCCRCIATAFLNHLVDEFLELFNSLHPRLQFTLEVSNCLNFLNVTIINANEKSEFNLYYKPTFLGRYLSFLSLHPLSQKRDVLMSMVDRPFTVFLFFSPRYHMENSNFVIKTFLIG